MIVVPAELFAYKQWVLRKRVTVQSRVTKIPISPWNGRKAACDQPRSWSTFGPARYVQSRWDCDGVGFVFTEQDPYCGIDLDGCRDAGGHFTPQALSILEKLQSFAELSPSGQGLHILVKAKLPAGRRRKNGIEMYDSGRYFTMSGKHISGTPVQIEDRQSGVEQLNSELFPFVMTASIETILNVPLSLSDKELIDKHIAPKAEHASADYGPETRPIMTTIIAVLTLRFVACLRFGHSKILFAWMRFFEARD